MSATATTAPPRRRSRLRLAYPLLVLLLTGAGAAGVWFWPSDGDGGQRTLTVLSIGVLAVVLLACWPFFLPYRSAALRYGPLALLLAGGTAFALSVRDVHFTGDMVPLFTFRCEKTHDDVVEEDRKARGDSPRSGTIKYGKGWMHLIHSDFLGEDRSGVVGSTRLETDWGAKPPNRLWRQPCGGGYSAFALGGLGPYAVTLEQRRDEEAVVAYEPGTGRELWAHKYTANFQERMGGDGPRATPIVALPHGPFLAEAVSNFKVYSLGATGVLKCLDAKTGKEEWSADVLKGNANLPWGMAGSPLVAAGEVIVTPGAQRDSAKGRAVIVYDARSGKELRAFGDHHGAYSSPVIRKLCGTEQLLVFDGDGLTGYDPKAGKELWHHPWVTPPMQINVAQPLALDDDRVFISSGYGIGCAMLRIKKDDKPEVLWQNKSMRCKFSSPVHRDGYLYGLDDGILTCLDAKSGEQKWKGGRYGHGQVLLADKHLLILSEKGVLVLVEATPERHKELARFQALEGHTWNPPALSMCFVFVRNDKEMACYELPGDLTFDPSLGAFPAD